MRRLQGKLLLRLMEATTKKNTLPGKTKSFLAIPFSTLTSENNIALRRAIFLPAVSLGPDRARI
jgi:hypothetical protein